MTAIRVAVIQATPVVFDVWRTVDKLGDLTADAARYARPDIFRLHVNEAATPAVLFAPEAAGVPLVRETRSGANDDESNVR